MSNGHVAQDPARSAALAWKSHLRHGGRTPWEAFQASEPQPDGDPSWAQQLELLRRLNLVGPVPEVLVEHVLTRTPPGRGRIDLRLPWPPSAPAAPATEVLRVGGAVLADLSLARATDLDAAGDPDIGPRVVGPPLTAAWLRRALADGRPQSRRARHWLASPDSSGERVRRKLRLKPRALTFVLTAPLDVMLAETWALRVRSGGYRTWPTFLAVVRGQGVLPPAADPVRRVNRAVAHSREVHYLRWSDPADLLAQAQRVAEVHAVQPPTPLPRLLEADVVEVVRRHNQALRVHVPPDDRRALARNLWDLLLTEEPVVHWPPPVPNKQRHWLATQAAEVADRLASTGYPGASLTPLPAPPAPSSADNHDRWVDVMAEVIGKVAAVADQRPRRGPIDESEVGR